MNLYNIYKVFIGEKLPYCGRIAAIGDGRTEAVSWPNRGRIVAVKRSYRGRRDHIAFVS